MAAVVPPPGLGFVMVTPAVPAVATSLAGMEAVSCVALTNVVVSAFDVPVPTAKLMTELDTKFVTVTVRVNAAPPGTWVWPPEFTVEIVGTGLLTLKVSWLEGPTVGVGLITVTLNVPAVEMSAAVIAAVSCVALTNVVVRLAPLNWTAAPLTNPVPMTVRANAAPPTFALVGDSEARTGAGLLMVKGEAVEVPPPGAGLVTVTLTTPAVAMSAAVIAAVI